MNNTFENTYFGKEYKTRDGRKALYNCFMIGKHYLLVDRTDRLIPYNMDGKVCNEPDALDIIGEWQDEPEKKLSIDDFPGLKAIKEELLKRVYKKVE